MNSVSKIILKNLSIGYKKSNTEKIILKNLDFEFHASEMIGIIGLNGTGKSTLLKSIAGLIPTLAGDILFEDKKINHLTKQALAKIVSIVLTEKFSGFNLKVEDVVKMGLTPHLNLFQNPNEKELKLIEDSIISCGLNEMRTNFIDEISDGYFQRMMIAKALVQQTPVMLLDEPSSYLDFAAKHELFSLLKNLSTQKGNCILISSHDIELLLKYCSKILIINESVELIDSSQAISNPNFNSITKNYFSTK